MMALRGGEMDEAVKGPWVFRRPKTWFGGRRFPQLATFGLTLERRVRNKWGDSPLSTNQRRGTRQFLVSSARNCQPHPTGNNAEFPTSIPHNSFSADKVCNHGQKRAAEGQRCIWSALGRSPTMEKARVNGEGVRRATIARMKTIYSKGKSICRCRHLSLWISWGTAWSGETILHMGGGGPA